MENDSTRNRVGTGLEPEEAMKKCNHTQEVTGSSPVPPTVNENSANFREMSECGLLVRTESGTLAARPFFDNKPEGPVYVHLYDPTNPEARRFLWEQVRENYYRYGIRVWWLDACEPEFFDAPEHDRLRQPGHAGAGRGVPRRDRSPRVRGAEE